MRPIWSGSLSFGLINIPVNVYSATQDHTIDLDLLHKKDMGRIGYQKICKTDGEPVSPDEIVKGYQIAKDEYVIFSEKEMAATQLERSRTIDILRFVDVAQVDTIYFERPYYLEPQKGGEKSYALLRKVLDNSDRAALAQFVMRARAHLAIIKPMEDVMVLNTMRYAEDIRSTKTLNLPSSKTLSAKEVALAEAIIDQQTEDFDPEEYRDTHNDAMRRLIDEKARTHKPIAVSAAEAPRPSKDADIMALLKASLENYGRKKSSRPRRRVSVK